jgi:hypothetical protein
LAWSADGSRLFLSVEGARNGVYAVGRDGSTTLLTSETADEIAVFDGYLVVLDDDENGTGRRRIYRLPLGATRS